MTFDLPTAPKIKNRAHVPHSILRASYTTPRSSHRPASQLYVACRNVKEPEDSAIKKPGDEARPAPDYTNETRVDDPFRRSRGRWTFSISYRHQHQMVDLASLISKLIDERHTQISCKIGWKLHKGGDLTRYRIM